MTDKSLDGRASVAYAPIINDGKLVSGTDYYDYGFSGTILWEKARTTDTIIDCFEYIGRNISDLGHLVSNTNTVAPKVNYDYGGEYITGFYYASENFTKVDSIYIRSLKYISGYS